MLEPSRISRAQRELRALIREAGENDPEALAQVIALSDWLRTEGLAQAAQAQHGRGYSWSDIGRGVGITRQTAHERFGKTADPEEVSSGR